MGQKQKIFVLNGGHYMSQWKLFNCHSFYDDRVPKRIHWWILEKIKVPTKYVDVIKDM